VAHWFVKVEAIGKWLESCHGELVAENEMFPESMSKCPNTMTGFRRPSDIKQ